MTRAKIGVKQCSKCGKTLPVSYFSRNKRAKDGLQPYCKGCANDIVNGKNELIRKLVKMLEPYRTEKVGEKVNDTVR